MLSAAEAERVASLMTAVDGDEKVAIDDEMRQAPLVAAAAVLLLRAQDLLADHAEVEQRGQMIVSAAIALIAAYAPTGGPRILAAPIQSELAANFAAERCIAQPSNHKHARM